MDLLLTEKLIIGSAGFARAGSPMDRRALGSNPAISCVDGPACRIEQFYASCINHRRMLGVYKSTFYQKINSTYTHRDRERRFQNLFLDSRFSWNVNICKYSHENKNVPRHTCEVRGIY